MNIEPRQNNFLTGIETNLARRLYFSSKTLIASTQRDTSLPVDTIVKSAELFSRKTYPPFKAPSIDVFSRCGRFCRDNAIVDGIFKEVIAT